MSQTRNRHDSNSSDRYDYLVKISGIPPSTSIDEIRAFLQPCGIIETYFFENTGNQKLECIVDLDSEAEVNQALRRNGRNLNNQNVELHPVTEYEFKFFIETQGKYLWQEPVIQMDGLPVDCTMASVQLFFTEVEIARNGIYISRDMADEAVGGGFVAFVNMDNAYKAIQIYDKKYMGDRALKLSPSCYDEAKEIILKDAHLNSKRFAGEKTENSTKEINSNSNGETKDLIRNRSRDRSRSRSHRRYRSNSRDRRERYGKRKRSTSNSPTTLTRVPPKRPNNRHSGNVHQSSRSRSRSSLRHSHESSSRTDGYLVKMRGMPYTVVEDDIRKFFPSSAQPNRIEILKDRRTHLPDGNAYVYFKNYDEAMKAMTCDRNYMGTRYVELYFDSPQRGGTSNSRHKKSSSSSRR